MAGDEDLRAIETALTESGRISAGSGSTPVKNSLNAKMSLENPFSGSDLMKKRFKK